MLDILKLRDKLKRGLGKKSKRNKIIGIILLMLIIITLTSYNEVKNINLEEKNNSQRLYNDLARKAEVVTMTLYDFKSSDKYKNYVMSLASNQNVPYNKTQLFLELKKRNSVYGKLGYLVSVADNISSSVTTLNGTTDKKEFYTSIGFPEDVENREKYINYFKEDINIYFNDIKTQNDIIISYIISLERNNFFSEIMPNAEKWYIYSNDELINLGNNNNKIGKVKDQLVEILNNRKTELFSDEGYIERLLGKKFHIFYLPSFDLTLLYIQSPINILQIVFYEFAKVFSIFIVIYILILIARHFIIIPIKQLAKKMGYIKNKDEKELEYIENKIEEIQNINLSLQSKILNLRNYQKQKRIKEYLTGITEHLDLTVLNDVSEIFKVDSYRVVIMEIFDIDSIENIFDKFNLSKELVLKYFSEEVKCEVVGIDYKSIAFILEERLTREELEEVLKCLVSHIDRNFNLKFSLVVTNVYNDVLQMPKAYRTAKKMLDYKYIYKQNSVIFQDRLKENSFDKYYYPIEVESKLILRTLSSNEISVKRIIDEMFNQKSGQVIDKKYVKEFGVLLYNTLNRILLQLNEVNENIDIKAYKINEILEINNAVDLKNLFQEKILDICKLTKMEEENDIESVKIKIERYLEENYMIDISLENLADHLGHSFKYTSVLFKKVMGDNFKNYLSIYRIEKSKEIMQENSGLRIKDLAELVGYNSSNTFIRTFRKYEGVSPGKYFGIIED
ncbi:MAG: AraC family transcriptional regulator [Fusobacterium sp.]|uniref:helix-turn-helix transcriptional regulator n=1 Tax=Fusobacterium sp. TaxID=68766 RepID=UPI0029439093|nr:AraC family transcriptional regulator [Fusobacterium sp.]MDY3058732.1 AraC family transcriptional regulator [Fusobacterium sp.]